MKKPLNKKDMLYNLVMGILLVIFLVSGGMFGLRLYQDRIHAQEFTELASSVPAETLPVADSNQEKTMTPEELEAYKKQLEEQRQALIQKKLDAYQALQEQNPDMIGWVKVDGTQIDYPVMQTKEEPEHYLHIDFNGKKSASGTPFMDAVCSWQTPVTNYLVYGHHMKNGSMFADLMKFTDPVFAKEHPYVEFDTLEQTGTYEVILAFRVDATDQSKPWEGLLFPKDQEAFMKAWEYANKKADYQSGITPMKEDHLLALVTCEYTQRDGRLMVLAREVDE